MKFLTGSLLPTITLTSGATFHASMGLSILSAASQANISLPYSCSTGRCSTCKCKVLSGSTTALHPETGLTDEEINEGWILSCVRTAESDLVLEVDDLGGLQLPIAKTYPCRINAINHLALDVVQIFLRLPPTVSFEFIPGQYVVAIGPNGVRRSYSLANSTFEDKMLELHIRAVPGGEMSQYWFKEAKINDLLRIHGPLGTFFLRETAGVDLYFLATGTGIAPVKAMLESIIHLPSEKKPKAVTVFWGGRKPNDFYFNLADIPGDHTFIPVLSRLDEDWSGAQGYVQNVLLDLHPKWEITTIYACGSETMIRDAKKSLFDSGLPESRFYSDAFVSSSIA